MGGREGGGAGPEEPRLRLTRAATDNDDDKGMWKMALRPEHLSSGRMRPATTFMGTCASFVDKGLWCRRDKREVAAARVSPSQERRATCLVTTLLGRR